MDVVGGAGAAAVALVAALASAATFGLATSLQHHAAGRVDRLRDLLRRPSWLLGLGLSVAAFGLHALALGQGSLLLVQPVVVTGIVFGVLIRDALERQWPSPSEVGWSLVTWAGLAAFLVGSGAGTVAPTHLPQHAGLYAATGAAVAGAALAGSVRARTPVGRGLLLGAAAGVLFGLVASLTKLVLDGASGGLVGAVTRWPVFAVVACGVAGVLVNQRAYRTTRLSVSMPLLNVVDVVVAVGFSALVLGGIPTGAPAAIALAGLGLVAMATGVIRLSRGPEEAAASHAAPVTTHDKPVLVGVGTPGRDR